ncbi:hypothetical protein [uncultured Thiodictyon sp.]|nr:hypothetical protein [uncultured Thiodictyon sp.]
MDFDWFETPAAWAPLRVRSPDRVAIAIATAPLRRTAALGRESGPCR